MKISNEQLREIAEKFELPPNNITTRVMAEMARELLVVREAQTVPDWEHISNEWADVATSALVWLKNIADGISTPDRAIENVEIGIAHCRAAMLNHSEQSLDMVDSQ